MSAQPCPRCGGPLRTQQVAGVITKYCDRCGPTAFGVNVKTGAAVMVKR